MRLIVYLLIAGIYWEDLGVGSAFLSFELLVAVCSQGFSWPKNEFA